MVLITPRASARTAVKTFLRRPRALAAAVVVVLAFAFLVPGRAAVANAQSGPKPTNVLVHGA